MFPMPPIPPGQEREFYEALLGSCVVALGVAVVLGCLVWLTVRTL